MRIFDDEDRSVIGVGLLRLLAVVAMVLIGAVTAGVALRLFQIVSGI